MKKIVVNRCYGGFGLSHTAIIEYAKIKGLHLVWDEEGPYGSYFKGTSESDKIDDNYFDYGDIPRDDPALVEVVEKLGDAAYGQCARLKIVEIPDDIDWQIEEYDGNEWVAENHQTW